MKKIFCIVGIVIVLTIGSVGVYADPWAEPGRDTDSIVVPPEVVE